MPVYCRNRTHIGNSNVRPSYKNAENTRTHEGRRGHIIVGEKGVPVQEGKKPRLGIRPRERFAVARCDVGTQVLQ